MPVFKGQIMDKLKKAKLGIGSYSYFFSSTGEGRFKLVNYGFTNNNPWTIEKFVDRAVDLGVRYVQLADNYALDELSDAELIKSGQYAKNNGVILESGMRGIMTDQFEKYIRLSHLLGVEKLRCVIDNGNFKPSIEDASSIINDMIPELKKRNIILGVENHDRITTEEFAKIMNNTASSHVGMIIDTVNSFSTMEPTVKIMETLSPFAVELHIKDYTIERRKDAQGLVIKGTVAGEGMLDIPYVIDMMKKNARSDFSTILEFWMEPEKSLELSIIKENEWVEKSLNYLKSII
jgi:sugar phosphate isomerase/epimerase